MKKAILSFGVIIIFLAYSVVLRHQHSPTVSSSNMPAQAIGSNTNSSSSNTNSATTQATTASHYKDGTYTGQSENAFYGNVQVAVTISGGKITALNFLQYPNDNPNSQDINSQATPLLKNEALKVQSASVDIVSGATLTSQAFAQSLRSALSQATS
jgi:uncharacterized protein with FMN-binding domain